MKQYILLISDIHGNYPALRAIDTYFRHVSFDAIINCGDSTVYAPYPNETIHWLRKKNTISILGNTDKKVIKLLNGKSFKKPASAEKRVMYETTAQALSNKNRIFLEGLPKKSSYVIKKDAKKGRSTKIKIDIFHGSPAAHHEFLFDTTKDERFLELAAITDADIVVTGHSHTPYYKEIGGVHFINPGSVGRMFDGNPKGSCATLHISKNQVSIQHYRIPYDTEELALKIAQNRLPDIYCTMYRQGRKLN